MTEQEKQQKINEIWGSPAPSTNAIAGQERVKEIRAKIDARIKEKEKKERPLIQKIGEGIADITGGKEIAQGLGQAIAQPRLNKQVQQVQDDQMKIQTALLDRIKEKKATGEDTSRLEGALEDLGFDISAFGNKAERILNPNQLTGKQVLGDALQLGTTVASVGSFGKGFVSGGKEATLKNIATNTGRIKALPTAIDTFGKSIGVLKGAGMGAVKGGAIGVTEGALQGTAQGLQSDKDAMGILKDAGKGALIGGGIGSVLGAIGGAISGGVTGRALRQAVLEDKVDSGFTLGQIDKKTLDLAKQQGFDETDIQFIRSMNPNDKANAQKMINLAKASTTDKRIIERPIDIVGDSMTNRIKFIQKQNSASGKAVDATAKSLKGQIVDATPVREQALSLLEDIGVTANRNGTPNWSKSIFKKTPELEKKIMKTLSDLPAGEMDAYDLHNFKKSIDEVVNYGVGGEGLKGKSASILKAIRKTTDEVLDNNFANYNKANTDYKATRDVLEIATDLFGKKGGISKERGGQLLRSVFSNSAQRPRVLAFIEQLENTSKTYGGKFKDNLIDQALFTEILEDVYGTQATTSLQGQVERAVKGTQRVIEGFRNPIKGAGDLIATGAEKSLGISDENKRKVLEALIR